MKKVELERMLTDPEGLKKLTERAEFIKQKYGEVEARPISKIRATDPSALKVRPTQKEIQANVLSPIKRRYLIANIGLVSPELGKEDPKKALSILIEKYCKDPSDTNQVFLEDAINRLTTRGTLDPEGEKLVAEAIKALTSGLKPEEQKQQEGDNIYARLYEDADFDGGEYFANHTAGVYLTVRAAQLRDAGLHDNISSLKIGASSGEYGAEVILFQHDRFFGRYVSFSATPFYPALVEKEIRYVGDFINDRTSSILVVRRYNNEVGPLSLGRDFNVRDKIRTFVESIDGISLRREPIVTWDLLPEGESGSHPVDNKDLIHIQIPVRVDVPRWFDYDAEIWYWIFIYVDERGNLQGNVPWGGCWVEGGFISERIADELMIKIEANIGSVQSMVDLFCEVANLYAAPYQQRYYLPGACEAGNTDDDVSIVLVRRM